MRLKAFRLLCLNLLIAGVVYSFPSKALDPTEPTSEKYLIDHGHSQEIIRMINLQKERTEGKIAVPSKSQGRLKKILKNLWFEQDLTMPITDFGYNDIKTVETNKSAIPPAIKSIKSKYDQKYKKKSEENNEVNINDIKVREAE